MGPLLAAPSLPPSGGGGPRLIGLPALPAAALHCLRTLRVLQAPLDLLAASHLGPQSSIPSTWDVRWGFNKLHSSETWHISGRHTQHIMANEMNVVYVWALE